MPEGKHFYEFGPFRLDPAERLLLRDNQSIPLAPKAFETLLLLVENSGHLLTKDELMKRLWPDTFVEEVNLAQNISAIRRALNDRDGEANYIETVAKGGYRFTAETLRRGREPLRTGAESPQPAANLVPDSVRPRWSVTQLAVTACATILVVVSALFLIPRVVKFRAKGTSATRGATAIRSIAVLPLVNLSSDPEQEYFSEGMTDELITDLAKFGKLRVISHTSVGRYKQTKLPLAEIARQLGVDAVVEGRVMRSGDRVRITAQLIDARSDAHLWAESYERDLHDVLALQGEVARRIAGEIGIKLTAEEARPASALVVNPAAHEAYLKGNFYWNRLNCRAFSRALDYFQQAVAQEPTYALAYVGVAESSFTLGDWGCRAQAEMFPQSKTAVLKAIQLDGSIGAAHAWLGRLYFFYDWDWAKAEAEFKQGSELAPNDSATHLAYGVFLIGMGSQAEGLAKMRRAHELDPIAEGTNVVEGWTLYWAHDYDSAIEQEKRTIELYPGSSAAYHWLAEAYEQKGEYEQAIDAYIKEKELDGSPPGELERIRQAAHRRGLRAYWQQELERTLKGPDQCSLPSIYGHLGERQKQLEALSQAYRQHCRGLNFLKVDPAYDGVRNDESFRELITRMRL